MISSNINSTIEELTTQIVTRYKVIFCNEPTYREPKKVILKSADDLILFGKDSISDVLSNMSQVTSSNHQKLYALDIEMNRMDKHANSEKNTFFKFNFIQNRM